MINGTNDDGSDNISYIGDGLNRLNSYLNWFHWCRKKIKDRQFNKSCENRRDVINFS